MASIGVISDTHGLLRPEALSALRGSDLVVHAGDIGSPLVIRLLEGVAPVVPVQGNTDRAHGWLDWPTTQVVPVGGRQLYVLHDLSTLDLDPAAAGFAVVISGHSHQPCVCTRGEVLYLNPGSAGPRRFRLPISVARLHIHPGQPVTAEIIELDVR